MLFTRWESRGYPAWAGFRKLNLHLLRLSASGGLSRIRRPRLGGAASPLTPWICGILDFCNGRVTLDMGIAVWTGLTGSTGRYIDPVGYSTNSAFDNENGIFQWPHFF